MPAAEIAAYLALADAQPTLARKMRLSGLIVLGRRGRVDGGRPARRLRHRRRRPVRAGCWCRSRGAGPGWSRCSPAITSGWWPAPASPRRVCDRGILGLAAQRDQRAGGLARRRSRPAHARCRAAPGHLAARSRRAIGLKAFMDAAGIMCSQRLGDLVATVATPIRTRGGHVVGGQGDVTTPTSLATFETMVDDSGGRRAPRGAPPARGAAPPTQRAHAVGGHLARPRRRTPGASHPRARRTRSHSTRSTAGVSGWWSSGRAGPIF